MADDDCYELLENGEPTGRRRAAGGVDPRRRAVLHDGPVRVAAALHPPRGVLAIWRDEFDAAYAEGGVFQLTMHPHIIGHRSRIVVLAELLDHIGGHDDVWFATHAQIAAVRPRPAGAAMSHLSRHRRESPHRLTPAAAQGDRRRRRRQHRRMGRLGRLRHVRPVFAGQFFAGGNETTALLSTLAVFAVGFVMRPIGGAVLGAYADRNGRKKGLTLTISLMAGGVDRHRAVPRPTRRSACSRRSCCCWRGSCRASPRAASSARRRRSSSSRPRPGAARSPGRGSRSRSAAARCSPRCMGTILNSTLSEADLHALGLAARVRRRRPARPGRAVAAGLRRGDRGVHQGARRAAAPTRWSRCCATTRGRRCASPG